MINNREFGFKFTYAEVFKSISNVQKLLSIDMTLHLELIAVLNNFL